MRAGFGSVQPAERLEVLDVLRGFALLGILQVNWADISGWLADQLEFFAEGSFYPIFSFLFGLGFALQMIRADELGRPFVIRYLWRTAILFLIGAAHFIFIWDGDVLNEYALVAPVLLLVRRVRPALVLTLATAVLLFTMAPPSGQTSRRQDPEQAERQRLVQRNANTVIQAYPPAWCRALPGLSNAYRATVCQRAASVPEQLRLTYTDVTEWQGWLSSILCMFLLGLYVGRRRILRDATRYTRPLLWVVGVSLALGLTGSALDVYEEFFADRGVALPEAVSRWEAPYYIGNIGLALFYVSSLTVIVGRGGLGGRLLAPLANVGRLALTNYLMQSIVFEAILGPAGFDVMSRVSEAYSLLLINAFFVVQILYSSWWLRHFQFGPVEWLWRSLTWWRAQPMRVAPSRLVPVVSS
jgi:uncharacterized protein